MKLCLLLVFIFGAFQGNAGDQINGAGASFPYPLYVKWFQEYRKVKPKVRLNYNAIGSSGGTRQLLNSTVDFGASDVPVKKSQQKKVSWRIIHIPTTLGAVVLTYNLPIRNLKLDGEIISKIFLGKIKNWNDPEIKKLNPRLKLPDLKIIVVRRAEGSGTTFIFSKFLSENSPLWKKQMGTGKNLRWLGDTVGGKGNDGVVNIVKKNLGAIGYVEFAFSVLNNLPVASIKNSLMHFVYPKPETISNFFKGFDSVDIYNPSLYRGPKPSKKNMYPISATTYILLSDRKSKEKEYNQKQKQIREFLIWALTKGQKFAKPLHYAPLPKNIIKKLVEKLH